MSMRTTAILTFCLFVAILLSGCSSTMTLISAVEKIADSPVLVQNNSNCPKRPIYSNVKLPCHK
ncbi:MAG: hypothetical protein OXR68_06295 [Alphaproteobacteria bacterium]|nr:hypothetical protein [Alphaproteobacteria bacterium]